jgi:hypothetical protein
MLKRIKVPHNLEVKMLFKNKHTCCICRDFKNYQEVIIHHIDGNPANNKEDNLAVLCLNHASMADAGLNRGKLGSSKKLKPDEVRTFKKTWESKCIAETKVEKITLPIKERRQLEILYKFEISKRKNEILSLPEKRQNIRKDHYEFLQQLLIEEFITGLKLRPIILKAFGDIGIQSAGQDYIALPLLEAIKGLFLHLVGPKEVKIYSDDKKLLLESLDIIETIGGYGGSISDDTRLLTKSCKAIYELAEVSSWYKFSNFVIKALKVLNKIKKDCFDYEPAKKLRNKEKLIKERIKIVNGVIKAIKKLK